MKNCPTCKAVFPDHFALCPHHAVPLVAVDGWGEGTVVRGKYRILSKVGQGGMGAVYKAMHVKFDEVRALKVMGRDLAAKPEFVKRFEREAILMNKLKHPNVVRVEDMDESEDGCPFIVMEFVEGRSLRKVLEKESPLAPLRACSIAKQAAAGLEAAHRLGMVHRDIKPDNIVLLRPDEGGGATPEAGEEVAKVLDFGIAKLKEAHRGDGLQTAVGVILGTPQYLSPEQVMGMRSEELDGRSDLYSLGLIMYQMLTGKFPFHADSTVDWLRAHATTPPTPISTVRPDLDIPESLAKLVMGCLEKDRERRPANAGELIREIERAEREIQRPAQPDPNATIVASAPKTEATPELWSEGLVIAGNYRILAKLPLTVSTGIAGAAEDPRLSFKVLQLKHERFRTLVVFKGGCPDEICEAFKKDALSRMKLCHPNVVCVEDVDADDEGRPFIVMEYVEGQSLARIIHQEAPLAPVRVCHLAKQVGAGLEAAHALDIVHGYVKPESIFVTLGADGEKPKLMGFGTLKLQEAQLQSGFDPRLLSTGHVSHWSPEQARKPRRHPDGRSDLYSLGLLMYQMLTGEMPYQANDVLGWLSAHVHEPPRPILSVRPDLVIPESLANTVMRCLEKDPERRPAHARELIHEIERAEEEIQPPPQQDKPAWADTRPMGSALHLEDLVPGMSDRPGQEELGTRPEDTPAIPTYNLGKVCPQCHTSYPDDFAICTEDGTPLVFPRQRTAA